MRDLKKILEGFLYRRGYEKNEERNGFEKEANKVSYQYQPGLSGGQIYCPDHITVFINDNPIIIFFARSESFFKEEKMSWEEFKNYLENFPVYDNMGEAYEGMKEEALKILD